MAEQKDDPYPNLDLETKKWFMGLIDGLVKNRSDAHCARVRSGLDLEMVIFVADEDRAIFTEAVCLDLSRRLADRTGVLNPVVYLDQDPHPQARQALRYRDRNI